MDKPSFTLDSLFQSDWLDLLRCLPDGSVNLVLSDLPYGVTACDWDTKIDLAQWWLECKRILAPRGAVVMTATQPFTTDLIVSNRKWFKYEWIWEKAYGTNFMNAWHAPLKVHENVLVFYDDADFTPQTEIGAPYRATSGTAERKYIANAKAANGYNTVNTGFRMPRSIIKFNNEVGTHPTQKPVDLFRYLIRTYTHEGALVVDPFVGSGTTAAAAKIENRRYICGDQSAEYIEIARRRVMPEFGKPPKRVKPEAPLSDLPMFADLE